MKQDAEAVADKAQRIVTIIARSQALLTQGNLLLEENADLIVPFTEATRQAWQNKVLDLKAQVKTIVSNW